MSIAQLFMKWPRMAFVTVPYYGASISLFTFEKDLNKRPNPLRNVTLSHPHTHAKTGLDIFPHKTRLALIVFTSMWALDSPTFIRGELVRLLVH